MFTEQYAGEHAGEMAEMMEGEDMGPREWTRDDIFHLLETSDAAVERAIVALHSLQTEDEQSSHTTRHSNGVGFNGFHAKAGTDMAEKLHRFYRGTAPTGVYFTPKQRDYARKIAIRHIGQLVRRANGEL